MGKISDMDKAGPLQGSELLEVVQDGKNRQTDPDAIKEFVDRDFNDKVYQYLSTTDDTLDMGTL